MARVWRSMGVVVCAALVAVAGGCLAAAAAGGAAAGAGAATYYVGKIQETFDAPVAKVYDAAVATLQQQGLELAVQKQDNVTGHLESEYADGKHVWIDMEALPEGGTKVSVRVGLMPDKDRAKTILDGIRKKL